MIFLLCFKHTSCDSLSSVQFRSMPTLGPITVCRWVDFSGWLSQGPTPGMGGSVSFPRVPLMEISGKREQEGGLERHHNCPCYAFPRHLFLPPLCSMPLLIVKDLKLSFGVQVRELGLCSAKEGLWPSLKVAFHWWGN